MTDWLALLLLFATYALALAFDARRPAMPVRSRRPQFDPVLPAPKRANLRLLRGALD